MQRVGIWKVKKEIPGEWVKRAPWQDCLHNRSMTVIDKRTHFDWLAGFVAIDNPTSSALTREALGWSPKESGLLTDMKESGYLY
jgi:hypothetical protein